MIAYDSDSYMFRKLTEAEVREFADYAAVNDPPKNVTWSIYHPACRAVWEARGLRPEDRP